MFRISRRVDYGMKMLIALAEGSDNLPVATATLAENLNIPLPFLHQIGHSLMQAGFIKASPGPKGGLRLSRSASQIRLLDVIEALEGPVDLNPGSEVSFTRVPQKTSLDYVWAELQSRITQFLFEMTLDQLVANGAALDGSLLGITKDEFQQSIEI